MHIGVLCDLAGGNLYIIGILADALPELLWPVVCLQFPTFDIKTKAGIHPSWFLMVSCTFRPLYCL
jgi:hypothetical protein